MKRLLCAAVCAVLLWTTAGFAAQGFREISAASVLPTDGVTDAADALQTLID